jgi:hypothetical protein
MRSVSRSREDAAADSSPFITSNLTTQPSETVAKNGKERQRKEEVKREGKPVKPKTRREDEEKKGGRREEGKTKRRVST